MSVENALTEELRRQRDILQAQVDQLKAALAEWPRRSLDNALKARKAEQERAALAYAVCQQVVEWAKAPGDHGGNPWCKAFVRAADKVMGGHNT